MRSVSATVLLSIALAAGACQEPGTVVVRSLHFVGNEAGSEDELRAALATRQSSRLPWGRQEYFDRTRLEADLKRIVAFYADRGYIEARVTASDVDQNSEQTAVDITITIDLGEPVRVGAIEYVGFDVAPAERVAELKEEAPLEVGGLRDRRIVLATHDRAVNLLRNHGYPYARVKIDEGAGAPAKQVVVTYMAEPGPLAHFGPVEIVGNESVSDRIIDRALTFRPGDLYRRSAVQESQRRLSGMQLFQFVNVDMIDSQEPSPEVRTRVTVAEGDHQRVNFGIGYGTEEKARVDGEYHHHNFFGGARTAGVHARWSSLDRGIRFDFIQPYMFSPRRTFGLDGQHWYTTTPAYNSTVTGGKATVTRRGLPDSSWAISILSEYSSSTITEEALNDPTLRDDLIALGLNPVTGKQEGTLNALALDVHYSTADSVLNPTRGFQFAFHAENAGRLLPGTFKYFALSGDTRHYLPIGSRIVAANRFQIATIDAAANEPGNVPFSKKYFLGGATTMRGWGRYEVSPLSAGLPIGGNTLFQWTTEVRVALVGRFGGVVFWDAGNVWEDDWAADLGDLHYDAGYGIRYDTPIGPVRFDMGFQLDPIDGLLVEGEPQRRPSRLHFSIGQAF